MALGEALERLRRLPLAPGALEGAAGGEALVVTGSGFWSADRLAIRRLCALAGGVTYSGDLVRNHTTLLLLRWAAGDDAPAEAVAAAAGGPKLAKALEWGVPAVRLAWLLDSAAAGRALPLQPYLVPAAEQLGAAAPPPVAGAAPGCRQLPPRHRPSSVASSPPGAAAAQHRMEEQQQQQQQPVQQGSAAQPPRRPMAPVANLLADQLRRMSISPEPPPMLAACPPQQQQQQQQQQQRSPSLPGSPQCSLSLRGLAEMDREGGTPCASAGNSAAAAHRAQRQQAEQPAAALPSLCSPMQDTPADVPLLPPSQLEQRRGCESPGDAPQPLALAFGRSVSEDLPAGSPMAESPAAAAAASPAAAHTAGNSRGAGTLRPRSRLAGTPASVGGQDPLCSMPTPACIRNWTDDDSDDSAGSPAAGSPGGC